MRTFSFMLASLLALIPALGVCGQEDASTPVEILAYTDDSLGERLVYRVKEKFRESLGFRLTSAQEQRLKVMINTTSTSEKTEGQEAIYSVIWLLEDYDEVQLYLFDILGSFDANELDATAEGILAKTDQLMSELQRAMAEEDPLEELGASLPPEPRPAAAAPKADTSAPVLAAAVLEYTKSAGANRLFRGEHETYGMWIDDSIWKKSVASFNPVAEMQFVRDGGEAYGMVIAERIEIPRETLRDFAVQYIRNQDPEATILKQEMRTVNGQDVLCIQIEATVNGIPVMYYSYQYTGPAGSIQVTTFTGQSLFEEYDDSMTEFLNGFVVLQ